MWCVFARAFAPNASAGEGARASERGRKRGREIHRERVRGRERKYEHGMAMQSKASQSQSKAT